MPCNDLHVDVTKLPVANVELFVIPLRNVMERSIMIKTHVSIRWIK